MNICQLTKGIFDCPCKKVHTCPVETVIIENNALQQLPGLCKQYKKILLVADENTWEVCGKTAYSFLPDNTAKIILKKNGFVVVPNEEIISEIEAVLTNDTELIIGVGSGVINDLCKYVSYQHGFPYFIVATAPSMDGYVSVGAALILCGMKTTVNARPPKAVLADTAVLRNAPLDMLISGYGDIVGKYSCLNDWKLSALINGEYFCQQVYDIAYGEAQRIEPLGRQITERNETAVRALMEALVIVGIAMSYVNCSRPASGSEHHLSHFFEITGILDGKPYFSHGIDVLYSAIVTERLREEIMGSYPAKRTFDRQTWESEIHRIYSSSSDSIIELQNRLGWYENDNEKIVYGKWDEIKALLNQAPSSDQMEKLAETVGLHYIDFVSMYGERKIRDAIDYAKDLKDRYTVLWLYYNYFRKYE